MGIAATVLYWIFFAVALILVCFQPNISGLSFKEFVFDQFFLYNVALNILYLVVVVVVIDSYTHADNNADWLRVLVSSSVVSFKLFAN